MSESEVKKRKNLDEDDVQGSEGEQEDFSDEVININWAFQDPAEIDFHAIKNLLRSLFDADAEKFNISALADMVLDIQKHNGTTIKNEDDPEAEPWSLFTVLDLSGNRQNPAIKTLIEYYATKTSRKPEFTRKVRQLFTSKATEKVGLILQPRLLNMPLETVPPLWRLYYDYVSDLNEPEYDYYLVVSKTFTEEESELDKEENRPSKRNKFANPKEYYHFHEEDPVIHETCQFHMSFPYSKEVQLSDSKRAFQQRGIKPHGHVMLLAAKDLKQTVENLEQNLTAAD